MRYFEEHGFTHDEVLEMLDNGVEPAHQCFNGARVDEAIPYPGLPDLDGLTPQWLKE